METVLVILTCFTLLAIATNYAFFLILAVGIPFISQHANHTIETFKKWFILRAPLALPLRAFQSDIQLYTWEDWHRDTKAEYPIRYFLQKTLPTLWSRNLWNPIANAWYWLRSHTVMRRHKLDLRNPEYQWGWCDASEAILYASFNLLQKFVEEEEPCMHYEEEDLIFGARFQETAYEIGALYHWWTVVRWRDAAELDALAATGTTREFRAKRTLFEETDDWMLSRLINIRTSLWT